MLFMMVFYLTQLLNNAFKREQNILMKDVMELLLLEEDGVVKLEEPMFGSPFSETMQGFDFYADDPVVLASVQAPADQMPKEIMYIPALLLLGLIAMVQMRRQRYETAGEAA